MAAVVSRGPPVHQACTPSTASFQPLYGTSSLLPFTLPCTRDGVSPGMVCAGRTQLWAQGGLPLPRARAVGSQGGRGADPGEDAPLQNPKAHSRVLPWSLSSHPLPPLRCHQRQACASVRCSSVLWARGRGPASSPSQVSPAILGCRSPPPLCPDGPGMPLVRGQEQAPPLPPHEYRPCVVPLPSLPCPAPSPSRSSQICAGSRESPEPGAQSGTPEGRSALLQHPRKPRGKFCRARENLWETQRVPWRTRAHTSAEARVVCKPEGIVPGAGPQLSGALLVDLFNCS